MGRRSGRTTLRPLADPDRLSHRIEYRRSLAELALSPGYRIGLLLQKSAQCQRKRLSISPSRINGAGGSRIVRHRSGHCKSRRLVRAALRQHTRTVLQQWCHRIYHPAGSLPHLGRIRKLYRKEQVAHGTLVHPDHSHAGYSFLRTWRQLCRYRHHRHRIAVALSQAGYAGEDQREISRIGTHTEHITIMHHDDCHRIFIIRTYRDPLHRQHTNGPELSGGHLHAGRIPGTRAIWYTPAVLRSGILLTSSPGCERRLLRTAHLLQRNQIHP